MDLKLYTDITAFIKRDKGIYVIKGKAGTGKTEIIKDIFSFLKKNNNDSLVVAPTNKAASVLRTRGVDTMTIHKALFQTKPKFDAKGKPITKTILAPIKDPRNSSKFLVDKNGDIKYEKKEEQVWAHTFDQAKLCEHVELLTTLIDRRSNKNNTERDIFPSSHDPRLINGLKNFVLIIDESSMIGYRMWKDLLENTTFKIIAVGDVNQLEPVETKIQELTKKIENYNPLAKNDYTPDQLYTQLVSEQSAEKEYSNYFLRLAADFTCTTNYRTKSHNIMTVFESVLQDKDSNYPTPFNQDEVNVNRMSMFDTNMVDEILNSADMVIAWRNDTVKELNTRIRKLRLPDLKYTSINIPLYRPGEPLYTTNTITRQENGKDLSISKGEIIRIITPITEYETRQDLKRGILHADVQVDSTGDIFLDVPIGLGALGYEMKIKDKIKALVMYVDLAYAITCHKAQGSQWGSVVVWDDIKLYGRNRTAWRYTAITRAENYLTILIK